jgi:hypothetical protein
VEINSRKKAQKAQKETEDHKGYKDQLLQKVAKATNGFWLNIVPPARL